MHYNYINQNIMCNLYIEIPLFLVINIVSANIVNTNAIILFTLKICIIFIKSEKNGYQ